jgi:protein-disulfide isomerase
MTKRTWIIFTIIIVGLLGALIYSSKNSSSNINVSQIDVSKIQGASVENGQIADHVYAKADSTVVLIEYGDFQCPACGSENSKIMKIAEDYKDKISFIFRNYPLTLIHSNAKAAAGAAEAAGLQGKYWEMHDLLYKNQTDWQSLTSDERSKKFISYAEELKLDTEKFKADTNSDSITKKINFDTAQGKKINISGTPTFVLNGDIIPNETWSNDTEFRKLIDSKL